MRIDSATATAMPSSTPSSATPRNAATESRNSTRRCCHSRTVPGMSASESEAAITTAASVGLGRFLSSPGTSTSISTISAAPTTPVTWVLAPGLLGDRGARSARADREPLEEAGGDVGGADADHLAVAVDLLAGARGERRGGGDRVGRARPARSRAPRRSAAADRRSGSARQRRKPLGQLPDQRDAVAARDRRPTTRRSRRRPRPARLERAAATDRARGSARG